MKKAKEVIKMQKYGILGLNGYEEKALLALLKLKKSKIEPICALSGIPRSRAYDVLESLVTKGFVTRKIGRPMVFEAIGIRAALQNVVDKVDTEMTKRKEDLKMFIESSVFKELEMISPMIVEKSSEDIIEGWNNILQHWRHMVANANNSIVIGIKNPDERIKFFGKIKWKTRTSNANFIVVDDEHICFCLGKTPEQAISMQSKDLARILVKS